MVSSAKIQKAVEVLNIFNDVIEMVRDEDRIKKEIDIVQRRLDDILMREGKGKKKLDTELANYKETIRIEINTLNTQRDNLKSELNQLPGQIASKKNSITNFDKQIDDLKIQVQQLTTERNGLQEEVEGVKAEGKKLASKFNE